MADTTALERTPNERTAWIVVCAIGFCLLAPWVLLRGMSLDGLIYATVARNMAVGLGDFWHPLYDAKNGVFHEHPPLGYALQSTFFRVLGDHWWVDRLYSVLTAVPMAGLMVLIWRRLARSVPRVAQLSWLAVMLWMVMPAWLWIYRNNYLENTLGIFTALAVYASLRALDAARWWPAWSALAAASIVAAVLCKGPVGLFPAVTPMLAVLALGEHSPRKGLLVQASLVVGLAALAGLVLADPAAREFLAAYLDRQVFKALRGDREAVVSRLGQFKLLWVLVQDIAPSAAVAGFFVYWARKRSLVPAPTLRRPILFAVLTGLSASLPIMISPKQTGHYAAPSWPFFMIALGLWCAPAATALGEHLRARPRLANIGIRLRVLAVGVSAASFVIAAFWTGTPFRDAKLIHDVEVLGRHVGPHATINIPPGMRRDWSPQAYLYRMYYISTELDGDADCEASYYLERIDSPRTLPSGCVREDVELALHHLYKRSETADSAVGDRSRR